jgi:hypothetical protein
MAFVEEALLRSDATVRLARDGWLAAGPEGATFIGIAWQGTIT